jgi:signal transduction histidine kinase
MNKSIDMAKCTSANDPQTPANGLKVLMVEDDPSYRVFVRQVLRRSKQAKFEFAEAGTMKGCKEILAKEIFDVILLDLNLPDSAGAVTFERVADFAADTPIVILTGSDESSFSGLQALGLGAQDFLSKHLISNDSLVRCLRYAIERKKFEETEVRTSSIQDFVATLAHDLRVPMIGTSKVLESLLANQFGELKPAQAEAMLALQSANNAQLLLVKKLLDLYKYEIELPNLSLQDLANIIKQCATQLGNLHERVITAQMPDDLPLIYGDSQLLARLFWNLLENAIKHGDRKQGVSIKAAVDSSYVVVSVHNFGNAISPEQQSMLFERFWQGVPGKNYVAHIGMGLYHCNRIASIHRAKLYCASSAEHGTTMTFRIAIAKLEPTSRTTTTTNP